MLRRVTSTSFDNTNFDATTSLSVTFIMSQCAALTEMKESSKIRHKRHSDLPFTEEAWAVSSVVEHLTFNQGVVGPTPTPLTSHF